jgi:hypothetical protein
VKVTDELAIVNSGLEDTMIVAYQEIREALRRQPEVGDLRTAAFVTAINKVAIVYQELGIFSVKASISPPRHRVCIEKTKFFVSLLCLRVEILQDMDRPF